MKRDSEKLIALHRYFISADRMRVHFENEIKGLKEAPSYGSEKFIDTFLYQSYWYSALYVVVEGWKSAKFSDRKIDTLLLNNKKKVALLKDYRNGTFHYHQKYWAPKITNLFNDEGFVPWIRELNKGFSAYFLREIRALKKSTTPPVNPDPH